MINSHKMTLANAVEILTATDHIVVLSACTAHQEISPLIKS